MNRCLICDGTGLMQTEYVVCTVCKGKICIMCEKRGGLTRSPYEQCSNCNGSGTYSNLDLSGSDSLLSPMCKFNSDC